MTARNFHLPFRLELMINVWWRGSVKRNPKKHTAGGSGGYTGGGYTRGWGWWGLPGVGMPGVPPQVY